MRQPPHRLHLPTAIVLMIVGAVLSSPSWAEPQADAAERDGLNPRWLERLDDTDRTLLEANIGYAPPAFNDDLQWFNHEPMRWDELRGSVVVLQSWTSTSAAGRSALKRLEGASREIDSDDVQMLAVHTPDGAEIAQRFLDRETPNVPVVVDPVGLFCDELGFYKRPTNVIIDRNGAVRYAGVRLRHAAEVVRQLLEEEPDADAQPKPRPKVSSADDVEFPKFNTPVRSARDVRGKKAPKLEVEQWITDRPDPQGKVVVIDFWATWCGPCIASIPHTNELANAFPDDVVVIGLSNEKPQDFAKGMQRLSRSKNITPETFDYALALDPKRRLQNAAAVRGIPHMLVLSSDWVVRWQGHPQQLNTQTLERIVEANRKLTAGDGPNRYRWTGDT